MSIRIIEKPIALEELKRMAGAFGGEYVKAVVDIDRKLMAVGGELHADEEEYLLRRGSLQENLWGVNLYPAKSGEEWIEFDSMINLRPWQDNRSRRVESEVLREKIKEIVTGLVTR